MQVQVPTPEEHQKEKRQKRKHLLLGLFVGIVYFGLIGTKIFFRHGFDEVAGYIWVALGFGVLAFGFLAYKFGHSFWSLFKR